MSNPILNLFNNKPVQQPSMIQQFQQFANMFKGNPQQMVQELLRNGKMSQEQFDQYSAIASQLTGNKNL